MITNCFSNLFHTQANHLVGLKQNYIKLSFRTVNDLMKVKRYMHNVFPSLIMSIFLIIQPSIPIFIDAQNVWQYS